MALHASSSAAGPAELDVADMASYSSGSSPPGVCTKDQHSISEQRMQGGARLIYFKHCSSSHDCNHRNLSKFTLQGLDCKISFPSRY